MLSCYEVAGHLGCASIRTIQVQFGFIVPSSFRNKLKVDVQDTG
jgi:hypothetical protein